MDNTSLNFLNGGNTNSLSYNPGAYSGPAYQSPTPTVEQLPYTGGNTPTYTYQSGNNYYSAPASPAPTSGTNNTQVNNPNPSPSGPSPEEIAMNNAYNDYNGYLDNMTNNLMSGKQDFLNQYTSPFDALKPELGANFQNAQDVINRQLNDEAVQHQSALDQAGQMFSEQNQGIQQRFGGMGAGSTGEFIQAYLARAQQQQLTSLNNAYASRQGALHDQIIGATRDYQSKLQQLDVQRAQALSQAQSLFNDRLDQIQQEKAQGSLAKAQGMLSMLQQLRQTAAQIEGQFAMAKLYLGNQLNTTHQNLISSYNAYNNQYGQPLNLNGYQGYNVNPLIQYQDQSNTNDVNNIIGQYGDPSADLKRLGLSL